MAHRGREVAHKLGRNLWTLLIIEFWICKLLTELLIAARIRELNLFQD